VKQIGGIGTVVALCLIVAVASSFGCNPDSGDLSVAVCGADQAAISYDMSGEIIRTTTYDRSRIVYDIQVSGEDIHIRFVGEEYPDVALIENVHLDGVAYGRLGDNDWVEVALDPDFRSTWILHPYSLCPDLSEFKLVGEEETGGTSLKHFQNSGPLLFGMFGMVGQLMGADILDHTIWNFWVNSHGQLVRGESVTVTHFGDQGLPKITVEHFFVISGVGEPNKLTAPAVTSR
jgi:hypothetical protein